MLSLIAALAVGSLPAQSIRDVAVSLGDRPWSRAAIEKSLGKPDKVRLTTCGAATKHPWECLIWTYEAADALGGLKITFEKTQVGWLLNSYESY